MLSIIQLIYRCNPDGIPCIGGRVSTVVLHINVCECVFVSYYVQEARKKVLHLVHGVCAATRALTAKQSVCRQQTTFFVVVIFSLAFC